ncbi:endonuclease/exonuclease/phosphatase family protein [Bacteroidota bacterium]
MKKAIKYVLYILLGLVICFVLLIGYASISNYKPEKFELINKSESPDIIASGSELSLMIWNIGYCGLSQEMDFFYEGGKQVRTTKQQVQENIGSVGMFLLDNYLIDFFLLQEVDFSSKRSYKENEVEIFGNLYSNFHKSYAKNYDVFFVPVPFTSPLGKVNSGLLTISRYQQESAIRYSFPGNFGWPTGLFMLDRCFLVNRYPVDNGKELLIINSHNSSYDDGSLRQQQMEYLKTFLLEEYNKGNYIIMGADWNQCPPGIVKEFDGYLFDNDNYMEINKNYLPETWTWLYDNKIPTNRRLKVPFDPEKCAITLIDYYLLSPNIEVITVEGIDLKFVNSDHNPVRIKVKIIAEE